MQLNGRCPLYVFLDESGNFDFTSKGTDHFVLSAVYTEDPCVSAAHMQALKYELLARKSADLEFHATKNSRGTRSRVFDAIGRCQPVIGSHTLYVDKHYAHPTMQSEVALLQMFGTALARWLDSVMSGHEHTDIIMVFDSVLTGKKQAAFLKGLKPKLKALKVPFHVAFHPVKGDMNGQIADYFAWTMFRKLEEGDENGFKVLQTVTGHSHFNLWSRGTTRWY